MFNRNNLCRKILVPKPLSYKLISFIDNDRNISYTDCFEISLYRILHLLFGRNGIIINTYLKRYMNDSKECKLLFNFFKKYNTYDYKTDEYMTGKSRFEERVEWCKFLNKVKIFKYKMDNKYEVCASFTNMIKFFDFFFPCLKLDEIKQEDDKINFIFDSLSFDRTYNLDIKENIDYSDDGDDSDDSGYLNFNNYDSDDDGDEEEEFVFLGVMCKHKTIDIFINDIYVTSWFIYESFDKKGKRTNGHSEYYIK